MTSRTDPALPLHRYRVAGTVAEIRADELALDPSELSAVLELNGVAASDEVDRAVLERTEGWAAGARLAALALRSSPGSTLDDVADDYLQEEVLSTLPEADRDIIVVLDQVDDASPVSSTP